uniref:Uncharacterized protein n=1 Tax=Meloidogyne hapla TaxID=6305 RepID=A0A1I8BKX4_MELHA
MFTYWPPVRHCFNNCYYSSSSFSLPLRCAISLGDLPDQIFLQILDDQKKQINSNQSSSSTQSFPQFNKRKRINDEQLNERRDEEENDKRIVETLQKRKNQKSVGTQTINNITFKIEDEELEKDENCRIICSQIAFCLLDIADRWAKPQKEKGFFGWLQTKLFGF